LNFLEIFIVAGFVSLIVLIAVVVLLSESKIKKLLER